MSTKKRDWCFTVNNYNENDETILQSITCRYLVYGRETAPETNTPHLQGYIYFENAIRFNTVRGSEYLGRLSNAPHIEMAKGTPEQNRIYCTKTGNFHEQVQSKINPKPNKTSLIATFLSCAGGDVNKTSLWGRFVNISAQERMSLLHRVQFLFLTNAKAKLSKKNGTKLKN